MASSFTNKKNVSIETKKAGYTTSLVAQTQATRGGSTARHDRSKVYCACDSGFRLIGTEKQQFLVPWWKAVSNQPYLNMPGYQVYMKCCLKGLIECDLFTNYSYVSRFFLWNNTGYEWVNDKVTLASIPTYRPDGADVAAFLLLLQPTIKGKTSYNSLMIDYQLSSEVVTPGEVVVTIPFLACWGVAQIDVYSYQKS